MSISNKLLNYNSGKSGLKFCCTPVDRIKLTNDLTIAFSESG